MVTVVKLIIYPSSHIVTSLGDFLRLIVGFIYSKFVSSLDYGLLKVGAIFCLF